MQYQTLKNLLDLILALYWLTMRGSIMLHLFIIKQAQKI